MASPAKIIVFSASFGGGHRGCAEAIKGYYRRHHSSKVEVEVVDFFETFAPNLNVLARFAFQQPAEFFPRFSGTFSELLAAMPANPVVHEMKVNGITRVREYLEQERPDAVISTFDVAGGVSADVAAPAMTATIEIGFDARNTWLHPATEIHFVSCREVREQLAVRGVAWDRTVVSGVPIREQFAEELAKADCRESLGLSERFTVMLTSVYSSPAEVRELALRLLGTGVQVALVAGRNEKLLAKVADISDKNEMLKVYGFVEDMHRMMQAADVIVGKAGELTVAEALAVGLPTVVCVPVPGQEVHSVDFLVNYGAGLLSRDEDDVVEKVRFLSMHPERLEQLSVDASALGKRAASQNVCERVIAAL